MTMRRRYLSYGLTLSLLLVMVVAAWHAQTIRDWWWLRSYTPDPAIVQLADRAGLSDDGKDYLYVGDPQLQAKEAFNDSCPTRERSLVLGCYSSGRIYILDVTDQRLDGIREVTAAHEMLHAAYDRLGRSERERVDQLLAAQFKTVKDSRIIKLIEQYRQQDVHSVNNELHSILATEYADLSPELEDYFARYFDNRAAVVALSRQYEAVFVGIEQRVNQLTTRIDQTKQAIDSKKQRADVVAANFDERKQAVDRLSSQLDQLQSELDALQAQNRIAEYNQQVGGYNQLVNRYNAESADLRALQGQYNALAAEINELIATFNRLVEQRRRLSYRGADLYNAIDSTYDPL